MLLQRITFMLLINWGYLLISILRWIHTIGSVILIPQCRLERLLMKYWYLLPQLSYLSITINCLTSNQINSKASHSWSYVKGIHWWPLDSPPNMMTSSNGNSFRVTGPLCGEFTGPGEFPTQRPVTRSFDVFVDLCLNKRLSKQPCGWWFETPSWSLWRQCNEWRVLRKAFSCYDVNVIFVIPYIH